VRTGPLTRSPETSSQRRTWAAEMYTSSSDGSGGETRRKAEPLPSSSTTPSARRSLTGRSLAGRSSLTGSGASREVSRSCPSAAPLAERVREDRRLRVPGSRSPRAAVVSAEPESPAESLPPASDASPVAPSRAVAFLAEPFPPVPV
jgi:hypothetical protein